MNNFFKNLARKLLGLETEPHNIQLKEAINDHGIVVDEPKLSKDPNIRIRQMLPKPTHPAPKADPNVIRPLHKLNGRHP